MKFNVDIIQRNTITNLQIFLYRVMSLVPFNEKKIPQQEKSGQFTFIIICYFLHSCGKNNAIYITKTTTITMAMIMI